MCGIVAASSRKNIVPSMITSLETLEYRGYDSAGIAVTSPKTSHIRIVGRINELKAKVNENNLSGTTGIGHTRWATHGQLNENNVHPLSFENIILVHNGVVENIRELTDKFPLSSPLSSETDSEFIAAIIVWWKNNKSISTLEAITNTIRVIRGSFALAIIDTNHPEEIYLTKCSSPLVVTKTGNGIFAASDPIGIAHISDHFIDLHDYDIACCSQNSINIIDRNNCTVNRPWKKISSYNRPQQLNTLYSSFMEKEIHEQPRILDEIINRFIKEDEIFYNKDLPETFWHTLKEINNIHIIGCGSSYHAAALAKNWFEDITGIHTEVDIASQFKGNPCQILENSMVIFVSQSGETADILEVLKRMPSTKKILTLALCNAENSTLAQKTNFFWPIKAGIEISVASTKTFSSQLLCLLILAIAIRSEKGCFSTSEKHDICKQVREIPSAVQSILDLDENIISGYAKKLSQQQNIIFLGSLEDYPLALEAALKIKELTYIHAEGYSSGEFKHGPLAMVDNQLLVVFIVTNSKVFNRICVHHAQVSTRKGKSIVMSVGEDVNMDQDGIFIKHIPPLCRPFCMATVLQQLARLAAQERGLEIDKPRNLAKSVTVE
ncbi:Glucosamine--fructose-6-phosphate aminotransferase [Candidatus Ichthyocystis hellenicum]|uniref:Glutamine--fructose-6-phosphate aminotransferase [isomerizing] n=2 Tax=Burkholderiales genera incertae sedis TaxID=224471 RepID=A0A0S4M4V8_9BURK|nr:Glucosamine--fructose-6-phosphate aminotransferase [Candidatus Ichthyocystis hellenicum]